MSVLLSNAIWNMTMPANQALVFKIAIAFILVYFILMSWYCSKQRYYFLVHYPTRDLQRSLGLLKHGVTIFTISIPKASYFIRNICCVNISCVVANVQS